MRTKRGLIVLTLSCMCAALSILMFSNTSVCNRDRVIQAIADFRTSAKQQDVDRMVALVEEGQLSEGEAQLVLQAVMEPRMACRKKDTHEVEFVARYPYKILFKAAILKVMQYAVVDGETIEGFCYIGGGQEFPRECLYIVEARRNEPNCRVITEFSVVLARSRYCWEWPSLRRMPWSLIPGRYSKVEEKVHTGRIEVPASVMADPR